MGNVIAQKYYKKLSKKYLVEARNFIPKYDEILKQILDLVQIKNSKKILDIGCGVGNLEELILKKFPNSQITCVEASLEMAQISKSKLAKYKENVKIIKIDILDFKPNEKYDLIISNLVLHNISYNKKGKLLKKIRRWLKSDGIFIWGDLIKYDDKKMQEFFVNYRLKFGLKRGGSKKFAKRNFEKEKKHDFPLTIEKTLEILRKVGYKQPKKVWNHDTFAIFYMKK
jgi:tRNA (cmo5U34)-methyltransferase